MIAALTSRRRAGRAIRAVAVLALIAASISGTMVTRAASVAQQTSPGAAFDVTEKTVAELQEALASGRVTSRGLVEAYLARVEAYDRRGPEIRAMIALNPRALEIADALDRERAARGPRGPLHGIPIVVKDNYDTADMPATGASLALAGGTPRDDAFQVRKLREAGAIIIGKTNMHELAAGITTISSLGGQTRNPYDATRNPGGSSGGTGAAVAASLAAFGMGSDTCGSIRIPSSHNSLVGLRGTAGLSSRDGIIPLSHTQDIGGPLARTVTDLAIALDATVGSDPQDPATASGAGQRPASFRDALNVDALKGTRIGVLRQQFGDAGDDREMADAVRNALDEMKRLGAEPVEVAIPDLDKLVGASGVIDYEFKFDLLDYLVRARNPPVASLGEILDRGLYHAALDQSFRRRNAVESRDSQDYRRALDARRTLADTLTKVIADERLTALAYPTMKRRPALLGEPQRGSTCQMSAHSGLPAISMPAGFTDDGLPVGIELLGARWSDATLVGIAYAFEQATHHRRPPLSTPPLVEGLAPAPVSFEVQATAQAVVPPSGDAGGARASVTFDRVRGRLRYHVEVTGVEARDVLFVAVHRGTAGQNGPVLYSLLDPGTLAASGELTLTPRDRTELAAGGLYLQLYTRAHPKGAARAQLREASR